MVNLKQLKMDYNYNLNRLYNGCNDLDENPDECNKYLDILMEIKHKVDELIEEIMKYQKVSSEEVLGGFKIC